MVRFSFLIVLLTSFLFPEPVSAQRQKKSIVSGGGAAVADPVEKVTPVTPPAEQLPGAKTPAKQPDIFDAPVRKPATATPGAAGAVNGKAGSDNKGGADAESGGIPDPEVVVIPSKLPGTAGVNLSCTFFASPSSDKTDESKVISPVILVHDWGGSMLDLAPLARHLQSVGHTVLVPDLRGHGRSTTIANQQGAIDYSEFSKSDVETILNDLEACKKYLMTHNNEGKLNISMLSVLAVGDMCPIATAWVLNDWSFERRGRIKQGKDVQSLVLVSPKKKFMSFSMNQIVKAPLLSGKNTWHIPTMVIWGEESSSAKESNAIYKIMAKNRRPSEAEDPADRWAQQDLYKLDLPVSEEGVDLLRPNEGLYNFIATFNQKKILLYAAQLPWQSRARAKKK